MSGNPGNRDGAPHGPPSEEEEALGHGEGVDLGDGEVVINPQHEEMHPTGGEINIGVIGLEQRIHAQNDAF